MVGRYILTPAVFGKLERTQRGGGEFQLTDWHRGSHGRRAGPRLAVQRIRYDCGNKLGYLRATVEYGLRHKELGKSFKAYVETLPKS